ncbi:MAG: nucleotidyltransferase domain-containing protein [Candidatus Ranarchaeia archaeon]
MTDEELTNMPQNRDNVIHDILQRIRPPNEELLAAQKIIENIIQLITDFARSYNIIDIIPCGSIAKGTSLKGDSDIDIFVRLDITEAQKLAKFAEDIGIKIATNIDSELVLPYAEHPYAKFITCENDFCFSVNIVPTIYVDDINRLEKVLQVSSMARTPLHTDYAISNLNGKQDDVRLLKYFAKQKKAYGIFSLTGWICELLIIHHGNFQKALQGLEYLDKKPIDLASTTHETELRKRFPHDYIIIVDPRDQNRNAAAGIQGCMGKCKLQRLREAARKGLKNPLKLFEPFTIQYNLELRFKKIEQNIIESNLESFLGGIINHLQRNLSRYDYIVKDAEFEIKPVTIKMEINKFESPLLKIKGPPLNKIDSVEEFKKAHPNQQITTENNRYYAVKASPVPTIEKAIALVLPDLKNILFLEEVTRKCNN